MRGTSCFHGLTITILFKKYSFRMLALIATESIDSCIKSVRFVERSKLCFRYSSTRPYHDLISLHTAIPNLHSIPFTWCELTSYVQVIYSSRRFQYLPTFRLQNVVCSDDIFVQYPTLKKLSEFLGLIKGFENAAFSTVTLFTGVCFSLW